MAEAPQFIDIDPQGIKESIKEDYETLTGKTLHPGQVEQLLINAFAYREYLLRIAINDAANLNLVEFSRAPFLDHLGQLVGVQRLTSSAASCQMKLEFTPGHGQLSIPAGIRFQSMDGRVVFTLDESLLVEAQENETIGTATAVSLGTMGNGYEEGDISVILDPQPYLASVSNIEITTGGADEESDDELRSRIMLAPQSYSNAGSRGAYEFHARSANPAIADISVTSPTPGEVHIYALLKDGELPSQSVLDSIQSVCNSEKIRPLTDTVKTMAPTKVDYMIDIDLTILTGSVPEDVINLVTHKLEEYAQSRKEKIGLDVVKESIIRKSMQEGVYTVNVIQPTNTIVIDESMVANCTGININIIGTQDA